jgi:hypothetical protein
MFDINCIFSVEMLYFHGTFPDWTWGLLDYPGEEI